MKAFKTVLSSLLVMGVMITSASGQAPWSDNWRWVSQGIQPALPQVQGYTQGSPMALTWGFARELTGTTFIQSMGAGNGANSNLIAFMDSLYGSGPGGTDLTLRPWFVHYQSTFDRWSSISGLSYLYEPNDDGVTFTDTLADWNRGVLGTRADVRIGGRPITSTVLGFNLFPSVGEMVINTNHSLLNDTSNNSLVLRNVLAHEHGHGIGQRHVISDNSELLMNPFINTNFDGPQHHDVLVAQRAYGDANERSFGGLGNDVAARATPLGVIQSGTTSVRGQSANSFVVAPNETEFFSIDDNSDTDFWSFTISQPGEVDILLQPLGFTYNAAPNSGGTVESFNSRERCNLFLSLFDTNGTSLLSTVNGTGFGGDESIFDFFLSSAGTYFVRIQGQNNFDASLLDTQFYGLSVGYIASVPEPSVLTLGLCATGLITFRRKRLRRLAPS